jgi:hypothetical protein
MDEREQLRSRIGMLQTVYLVLFVGSLILLAVNWGVLGHTTMGTIAWAVALGSAVAVRLYRTSLVNKYNALVSGDNAPLT